MTTNAFLRTIPEDPFLVRKTKLVDTLTVKAIMVDLTIVSESVTHHPQKENTPSHR